MKKISERSINALYKGLETLENAITVISEDIEKGENYLGDKPDKWRDSEIGERYEEWIENIDYQKDELENIKHDLEMLLNEFDSLQHFE
ncbi:MAG: hypothetical protein U9P71_01075 [Campylobacterota bacterium]|nr:hypothetical protein [Campylobacterota bacterium]